MNPPGRLATAVLVSAAAHTVLLGGLLATSRPPRTAAVTSVRLVEVPKAFGAASGDVPREVPREVPKAFGNRSGDERQSFHESFRQLREVPSRKVPDTFAGEVPDTFGPDTFGPPSDGDQGRPAAGPAVGAGSGPEGPKGEKTGSGGTDPRLAELHRRLAEAAARCYPPSAQRLRLRGEVPLRFCLDAHGGASGLSLLGTTGSALLDRSALECVVPGAEPLPPLAGCFQVAVRFGG